MSHEVSSIWSATATVPPAETPLLVGTCSADVVVVGAGGTGLAAAIALAEGGASVVVLDAEAPGFGGSGRNGGQVIPGLKYDPDELDLMFGEATTDFVGRAAETTFALIERLGISCGARQGGWIQGSVKHDHMPALERRMMQWRRRGAATELLDAQAMARRTGATSYVGGWLDGRAGVLHPLDYSIGLARAAIGLGVRIHGKTRATRIFRDGTRWAVETAGGGRVDAGQVVIGTNGYTDALWPRLKATIIPASSFQVATAPVPEALRAELIDEGMAVSDSRRIANYLRLGPGGRLMIGGRGNFTDTPAADEYHRIEAALRSFFPQLRDVPVEFRWTGRVAMTEDHLPHLHTPAPGVFVALGYNGRGVALSTALGSAIGAHILDPSRPLPLSSSRIKTLPIHSLHPIYATMVIWYYRLRDMLEH